MSAAPNKNACTGDLSRTTQLSAAAFPVAVCLINSTEPLHSLYCRITPARRAGLHGLFMADSAAGSGVIFGRTWVSTSHHPSTLFARYAPYSSPSKPLTCCLDALLDIIVEILPRVAAGGYS